MRQETKFRKKEEVQKVIRKVYKTFPFFSFRCDAIMISVNLAHLYVPHLALLWRLTFWR